MPRDYYDVLGISRTADEREIRRAFRKLARQYHPDLNPGDESAERKFKEVNEANEVLSDPDKRTKYDRYGDKWMHADRIEAQGSAGTYSGGGFRQGTRVEYGFGDFGDFGDLDDIFSGFGDIFNSASTYGADSQTRQRRRAARSNHLDLPVTISLEEAFHGTKRKVNLPTKDGSSRSIEISIPAAVDNGSRVHISLEDGTEVFLVISVTPHNRFKREGDNLYADISVPFEDAVLGGEVEVASIKGRLALKIPPGSESGKRIRIQRHGMPMRTSPSINGDLYVTVKPQIPTALSPDEKKALEEFRRLRIENGKRK